MWFFSRLLFFFINIGQVFYFSDLRKIKKYRHTKIIEGIERDFIEWGSNTTMKLRIANKVKNSAWHILTDKHLCVLNYFGCL